MPENDSRTVPATVRTIVSSSTIQIVLLPGVGMADGGIPVNVPIIQHRSKVRTFRLSACCRGFLRLGIVETKHRVELAEIHCDNLHHQILRFGGVD